MRNAVLPLFAVLIITLASCGGSESVVTSIPATVPAASAVTPTPILSAPDDHDDRASGSGLGSGVARTHQQERLRLRALALEQKRVGKKARKNKPGGFFSSLLSTSSSHNSSAQYRRGRNGNNTSSLNGLFGRRKGRRR